MKLSLLNEASLAVALIVAIAALAVVTIVSGPEAVGPTRLPELAAALVGALAGTKIPKP